MIEEKQYKAETYFEINAEDEAEGGWDGNVEAKAAQSLTPKQKGMKGMIYMMISSITAALMAFILKELYLNSNITAFEVTYWQSMIIILVEYVMLKWSKKDIFNVPDGIRITFILRCIAGFLGTLGYFLAL